MNIRAMKPGTVDTPVRDAHLCLRKNRMTTAHALNVAEALNRAGFKKIVCPAVSNSGVRNNHLGCEYDPLRSEGRSYPDRLPRKGVACHLCASEQPARAAGRTTGRWVGRPAGDRFRRHDEPALSDSESNMERGHE